MMKRTRKAEKRGPGRPPIHEDQAMTYVAHLKFPLDVKRRVQAIRTRQIEPPSESAVLREAVLRGLAQMEAGETA